MQTQVIAGPTSFCECFLQTNICIQMLDSDVCVVVAVCEPADVNPSLWPSSSIHGPASIMKGKAALQNACKGSDLLYDAFEAARRDDTHRSEEV